MLRSALAAACFLVAFAASAATQERVVNIYNWSDYVDPKMLDAFTRETGIKVVYDTYDTNEIVETKLLAGKSGYDIVVPSGPFLQRMIKAGIFQPLDRSKLPNLVHAWPDIAKRLAVFDPGNRFAVNYMWGTTGLGFNVAKVAERLRDVPTNSLDILLKPQNAARLKDCGVQMLDSPEDLFPGILNYLGLAPDSKSADDLQRVGDTLMRVRGSIQKFHSSEYINALANGDICLVLGYSGDIMQARRRAAEAKNGVEIAYVVPREGALMWFDSFAIPADAPHAAEAHAFIDFMMRPEVAAANVNAVSFASGNLAARALVKPEIRDDAGIYPDEATFKRLFTNTAYDERAQRIVTRIWTRVKAGR